VPFVKTGSRTFVKTTEVALGSISENLDIYYTLDGSEPTLESAKFAEPFVLNESAQLRAFAYADGLPASKTLVADFYKIPIGRKININTAYANQYAAGGNLALIDFIRGPLNYRTGAWQGYEGVDLDAVVDLGNIQLISKIEVGFLQDVGAWIFMPLEVQYYVSRDGLDFQHIGTIQNDVSHRMLDVNLKNFTLNFSTKARYIKVIAKNQGNCPEWHPGDGQPAWIFADEILIK
jgi:hypothetical protein